MTTTAKRPNELAFVEFDEITSESAVLRVEPRGVEVMVHDATRLAWQVSIPLPATGRADYEFEFELEAPVSLPVMDPWPALQQYARLDHGVADSRAALSVEAFRRRVVTIASNLARARDGFVRHCTAVRAGALDAADESLTLWLGAATRELDKARATLLHGEPHREERVLADEFLSIQLWTVLTDCARALADARAALAERGEPTEGLDLAEHTLADAIAREHDHRRQAGLPFAEPVSLVELERLLARGRLLKKHFERVSYLEVDSYQVVSRLAGWFSAITAMLAYLWFSIWQFAVDREAATIGSGMVAVALVTAIAYASRERLKEIGRNWLTGRAQRMFAQRVTRFRLPAKDPRHRATSVVASAHEWFSESSAHRPDPLFPAGDSQRDVTIFRFAQRGHVTRPADQSAASARQVRFVYRFDVSAILPRLHDAIRGLASVDERTGKIAIVDVARNYELSIRARLRHARATDERAYSVVLNKNGLLRIDEESPHDVA